MLFRSLVFLLATVCAGCSTDESGSTWTGSVTDSAGVTIVSNSDEPIWTDVDRWTVEQNLVIGAVDGDANYLFGNITGICVATDRRLYVLDQAAYPLFLRWLCLRHCGLFDALWLRCYGD